MLVLRLLLVIMLLCLWRTALLLSLPSLTLSLHLLQETGSVMRKGFQESKFRQEVSIPVSYTPYTSIVIMADSSRIAWGPVRYADSLAHHLGLLGPNLRFNTTSWSFVSTL